jgi:hypothetical protein
MVNLDAPLRRIAPVPGEILPDLREQARIAQIAHHVLERGGALFAALAGVAVIAAAQGPITIVIGTGALIFGVLKAVFRKRELNGQERAIERVRRDLEAMRELLHQQDREVQVIQGAAAEMRRRNEVMNHHLDQMGRALEVVAVLQADLMPQFQEVAGRIRRLFEESQQAHAEVVATFERTGRHLYALVRALEIVQQGVVQARDREGQFVLIPDQRRFIEAVDHAAVRRDWLELGEKIQQIVLLSGQLLDATMELIGLNRAMFERIENQAVELRLHYEGIRAAQVQQRANLEQIELHAEAHQARRGEVQAYLLRGLEFLRELREHLIDHAPPLLLVAALSCIVCLLSGSFLPLLAIPIYLIACAIVRLVNNFF